VEALRRRHEVTVLATGAPAPGKVCLPGFQIPIRAMRENRITFGWPSRHLLEPVFASVDLVHVQFPFYLGFAAAKLAVQMGVPLVSAFHVQPENLLYNIHLQSPRIAGWMHRWWIRNVFEPANAVVVPSRFAGERLQQYGLTTPTYVISNGAHVPPRPRAVRVGTERRQLPYVLLCVGRLAPEKRQDVIIDAVARCQHRTQVRLVVAGAGHLEPSLRKRAKRLGLPVEFGYVSNERLLQLYDGNRAHALRGRARGHGGGGCDGGGIAVLVADAPDSAARAFASGPEFHFRPGDATDLAAHIDRLLENPAALCPGRLRRSLERSAQHDFQRSTRQPEHLYEARLAHAAGRSSRARARSTGSGAA
jgi:glycosyltransferase involved in cell wall biosynthesis